jgi:hypothetical protein
MEKIYKLCSMCPEIKPIEAFQVRSRKRILKSGELVIDPPRPIAHCFDCLRKAKRVSEKRKRQRTIKEAANPKLHKYMTLDKKVNI